MAEYTTKDTNETVTFTAPHGRDDAQGYALDGYDWMDAAATTNWYAMSSWGKDGWDAGQWPYVIITLARGSDKVGPFFGITTYCEGDLDTTFYRHQMEQWRAITEWCRWNWVHGQGDGPKLEQPVVSLAEREIYGRPFGDEYDNKVRDEGTHHIWHIERRDDGQFYAVHQHGGWMRFPGKGEAEEYVARQVRLGDEHDTTTEGVQA